MRAVIDTNVLLSGLLWHGAPHALLERVRAGTLILISSPMLLSEMEEVIGRAKFDAVFTRSSTSREHVLAGLRQLVKVIEPPPLAVPVCRDPDDDAVLALALASRAEIIISGDDDLLALKLFQDIPIVAPVKALQLIAK